MTSSPSGYYLPEHQPLVIREIGGNDVEQMTMNKSKNDAKERTNVWLKRSFVVLMAAVVLVLGNRKYSVSTELDLQAPSDAAESVIQVVEQESQPEAVVEVSNEGISLDATADALGGATLPSRTLVDAQLDQWEDWKDAMVQKWALFWEITEVFAKRDEQTRFEADSAVVADAVVAVTTSDATPAPVPTPAPAPSLPPSQETPKNSSSLLDRWNKIQDAAKKASNHSRVWWGDFTHTTEAWWNATSEESVKVWNTTSHTSVKWWDATEHWFVDTANKTENWFVDSTNKTEEWWVDTENKTVHWWVTTENTTEHWYQNAENITEHWWVNVENTTSDWIQSTENATSPLWDKGVNITHGAWVKAKNKSQAFWIVASNKTQSWSQQAWNQTEFWWQNVTYQNQTELILAQELMLYMNESQAFQYVTTSLHFVDYAQDYFLIEQGSDAQINQAYCPVATSAAILNSFRGLIDLPTDPLYDPYPYATQSVLFNDCTNKNVILKNSTYDGIFATPGGLGMPQTKALLECHLPSNASITAVHLDPDETSVEDFRNDMLKALTNAKGRVMVNYNRKIVNQTGGGHWSPIGGYSKDLDSLLVMDVAKYKYPSVWIPVTMLYRSLQTWDMCGKWNFPDAQLSLDANLLHAANEDDYALAMKAIGCKATRRGYIIVEL